MTTRTVESTWMARRFEIPNHEGLEHALRDLQALVASRKGMDERRFNEQASRQNKAIFLIARKAFVNCNNEQKLAIVELLDDANKIFRDAFSGNRNYKIISRDVDDLDEVAILGIKMSRNEVMIPTHQNLGFLNARNAAIEAGGRLPTNAELDKILMETDEWQKLAGYSDRWWTGTVIVHLSEGMRIKKGKDIVESWKDINGEKWILPGSSVPVEAVGRPDVGIVLDNPHITVKRKRVVVEPSQAPIVIDSLPHREIGMGHHLSVNEISRVPSEVSGIPNAQKVRILGKFSQTTVTPISRRASSDRDVRSTMLAGEHILTDNGIAIVQPSKYGYIEPEKDSLQPILGTALLVNGLAPEDFKSLSRDAQGELERISAVVGPEELGHLKDLVAVVRQAQG